METMPYIRRFQGLGDSWEVRWYGGSTFHIYVNDEEVDVFTRYGDDKGNPCNIWDAAHAIEAWARTQDENEDA